MKELREYLREHPLSETEHLEFAVGGLTYVVKRLLVTKAERLNDANRYLDEAEEMQITRADTPNEQPTMEWVREREQAEFKYAEPRPLLEKKQSQ